MDRHNPQAYHMVSASHLQRDTDNTLILPPEILMRLRPGEGILIGTWDEDAQVGTVNGLAVVTSLDIPQGRAGIEFTESEITLKPNPSGRRWWRNPHFKFAETVRQRYMLDDIFAEHFPGYADMDLTPLRHPPSPKEKNYLQIAGYIYVLKSEYGYKIGKTVNLKDRIRLFGVKLPFKFDLIVTGQVENYSKAEAELHKQFAEKRLDGEWFALNPKDIEQIRCYLASEK